MNGLSLLFTIWKIQDLGGKIWKIQDLAGKIWKIQYLAGKIWKIPDLATHHSLTRCSNSRQITHQLAGPGGVSLFFVQLPFPFACVSRA